MVRFNAEEADNYGGNRTGGGYFSLKNDKDTAKVRFMFNSVDDANGYTVHEIEMNGKKRYVGCIRSYNEDVSACPFCAAGSQAKAKAFFPIYNIDSGLTQVWERGKTMVQTLSSFYSRYNSPDKPFVSHIFEIERNGKSGDQGTTYNIYEMGADDTRMEDLPEMPNIVGGVILDKTYDEMQYYVDYGEFPDTGDNNGQAQANRGGNQNSFNANNNMNNNAQANRGGNFGSGNNGGNFGGNNAPSGRSGNFGGNNGGGFPRRTPSGMGNGSF